MYYKRKSTWHILHLILTVIFFPWALIWIIRTLTNNSYNRAMEHQEMLDAMGRIGNNPNNSNWKE